jgi:hypothetical protein
LEGLAKGTQKTKKIANRVLIGGHPIFVSVSEM